MKFIFELLIVATFIKSSFGSSIRSYGESMEKEYDDEIIERKQVGWVIYRNHTSRKFSGIQYLLLQARHGGYRWALAKTPIRKKYSHMNELEAAMWRLEKNVGLVSNELSFKPGFKERTQFKIQRTHKMCTYFLAELLNPKPRIKYRMSTLYNNHQWVDLHEALKLLEFPDMRDVVISASEYIKKLAN